MRIKVRIELLEVSSPTVWRELFVPLDCTFHDMHKILQVAMGWMNSHLYSFKENHKSRFFTIDSPYDEEYGISAKSIPVKGILMNYLNEFNFDDSKSKILYTYDLGDTWEHEITVLDFDRVGTKAELIAGEGACPPEDCGGIDGFEDIKESLATGNVSKIHGESWKPWLNGCGYKNYDPNKFDLAKAQKGMAGWKRLM